VVKFSGSYIFAMNSSRYNLDLGAYVTVLAYYFQKVTCRGGSNKAETYLLKVIFGVGSAESCLLATKINLKAIH
jgi:hypothetical protein